MTISFLLALLFSCAGVSGIPYPAEYRNCTHVKTYWSDLPVKGFRKPGV